MKCPLFAPMVLCCLALTSELYAQALPLDGPLRAIHIGGYWGANRWAVNAWDPHGTEPLIPLDYIEYLQDLHVNWVGISVALHYEDSMDSTVERAYSPSLNVPTFSDAALRQLIREFRAHDFEVYLTLAFESHEAYASGRPAQRWQLGDPGEPDAGAPFHDPVHAPAILPEHWPWRPSHPDHDRFVGEFWETYTREAVHFAKIAQQEGVGMYSLGTETDVLFRTRPTSPYFANDFGPELRTMVDSVRSEYHGLLTYDMHYFTITDDFYAGMSDALWEDLDLDIVGVSAWFNLAEAPPSTVMSVDHLRQEYERIFQDHLVPLAADNAARPIVFTEYGAIDTVEGPAEPSGFPETAEFVFSDLNGNGVDDGRETQANIFQALFETMDRYPDVVHGAFFWDNWIASNEDWERYWTAERNYDIRAKPAGEIVRAQYERWRSAQSSQARAVGRLPDRTLYVGLVATAVVVPVTSAFRNAARYEASSSQPGVASVSVSGSTVTVTSVAEGVATVTVTASGPDGVSATQQFNVTVLASASPRPTRLLELRRRIEALRGREPGT